MDGKDDLNQWQPDEVQAPAVPPPPSSAGLTPVNHDPNAVLLQIGDIGITSTHIITPNGVASLTGSSWVASDQTRTEEKIPAYAIVLAVLFFLACFLGLSLIHI